jgi:hypothetical protein
MSGDENPLIGPVEVVRSALKNQTDPVPEGYSANALVHQVPEESPETCGRLLSVFDPVNVLGVAIEHDPAHYVRICEQESSLDSSRLAVVDVTPSGRTPPPGVRVETVGDAEDLTGIGIAVTQLVKQAARSDVPTVVCFDSLTPLLQYSDVERCYRFLDTTTSRLNQVCAVSHAHIDPAAHDEQTLQQLASVFDAVVRYDDDTWRVASS